MKTCKWYKRLFNVIIDFFAIEFITLIILSIFRGTEITVEQKINISDHIELYTFSFFTFLFVFIFYYFLFEYFTGKTLGKLITKSRVIVNNRKNNKKNVTFIYRTLSRILFFEIFWYFRNRPKGLHDIFSRTTVIDD